METQVPASQQSESPGKLLTQMPRVHPVRTRMFRRTAERQQAQSTLYQLRTDVRKDARTAQAKLAKTDSRKLRTLKGYYDL